MINRLNNIKPLSMLSIALIVITFYTAFIALQWTAIAQYSWGQFGLLFAGFISILGQALFVNKLAVDFDIVYKHSYLPAYFYALFVSSFTQNLSISYSNAFTWLVLLAIYQIISIPKAQFQRQHMYFAAIFFGLISFFIPFYSLSFILLLLLIFTFKNITLLDFSAAVLGMLLPLLLMVCYNYLFHKTMPLYAIKSHMFQRLPYLGNSSSTLVVFWLIGLAGIGRAFLGYFKNNIQTRKMLRFMLYFTLFHLLILIINWKQFYSIIILLAISFSIFSTYFFMGKKWRAYKNIGGYLMWVLGLVHLFLQLNSTYHWLHF